MNHTELSAYPVLTRKLSILYVKLFTFIFDTYGSFTISQCALINADSQDITALPFLSSRKSIRLNGVYLVNSDSFNLTP
jgi:hypothetical protein